MTVKNRKVGAELKQLKIRHIQLTAEERRAKEEMKEAQQRHSVITSKLKHVHDKIESLKTVNPDLTISEHAILRYLERVLGVDIEGIKKEIICDALRSAVSSLGDGTYPILNTPKKAQCVVKNNHIITIK